MKNNFWFGRRVFITGCTGLLGSWLTSGLVKHGADVVGLIRDNIPQSNFFDLNLQDKIRTISGDLEDYRLLERILNEYEIETIFHLGAQTIVKIANDNPVSTFESNIKGTWNILESARRATHIKAIVVASSDKAYGEQKNLPYTEDTPLEAKHPYDVSKSCADLIAQAYFHTYKLPICVTRCGNLFGGGDLNFNRIIPETILSLLKKEAPIIRSDGTSIRDYIYVKDIVSAYLLLAEKMHTEANVIGEVFNFSYERQISVRDLVGFISKSMKVSIEPVIKNEAWGEIKHQYLSAEKAKEMLSWQPIYSMEKALAETIAWYKEYFRKIQVSV